MDKLIVTCLNQNPQISSQIPEVGNINFVLILYHINIMAQKVIYYHVNIISNLVVLFLTLFCGKNCNFLF
jgi:homogentisate 1,2-dioxygenase